MRGEKVYQVPDFGREIRGVKFLRNGLLMGEMKKNRFEPSQALAMALKAEEFDSVLKLNASDERVERYLRGGNDCGAAPAKPAEAADGSWSVSKVFLWDGESW